MKWQMDDCLNRESGYSVRTIAKWIGNIRLTQKQVSVPAFLKCKNRQKNLPVLQ